MGIRGDLCSVCSRLRASRKKWLSMWAPGKSVSGSHLKPPRIAFVLAEAERCRHRKAIRELRAIGPPPHAFWDMVVERKWITRFVGIVRGMSLWRFTRITLGGPEASIFDLPNILQSQLVTPKAMWPELIAVNLITTAPSLRMPVFFFLGRHDRVVVPETSVAYFDVLQAPSTTLIWFEESSHEPPAEEPEKFNRLMVELVRPAAVAASA